MINRHLKAHAASIMIRAGECLEMRVCEGDRVRDLIGARQPITEGVAGSVARNKRPLLVANARKRAELPASKAQTYSTGSFICVPIMLRDQVMGIIRRMRFLDPILPAVRHHHERIDGTGYPDGLTLADIPLLARMLAIADAFGAMTSPRPHRKAMTGEQATAEIMAASGLQFDPELAKIFCERVISPDNQPLDKATAGTMGKRVLIPRGMPERTRLEQLLHDDGWQTLTYQNEGEAEEAFAETPPTAILLTGSDDEPRQVELVKTVRHASPQTMILRVRPRGEAPEEPHNSDALVREVGTPEEIVMAVRMGEALRREQEQTHSLREHIDRMEAICNELRQSAALARKMALHDELTGLYNRRYFLQAAAQELERARRESRRFAIAVIDIDHFKNCNDTHGHLAGDHVLQQFAKALMARVRRMDTVARYGGEEFIILLPETSLFGGAAFDAAGSIDRLRRGIARMTFNHTDKENSVHLTLSAGIAEYPKNGETVEELVSEADVRLYRAKSAGRNCVHTQ